jgi:hypothetical protein
MQAIKNCNCVGKKKSFTHKSKKCKSSSSSCSKSKSSSSCTSSKTSKCKSSSSSCSSSSSSCSESCILIPPCSDSSSSSSCTSSCGKSSCHEKKEECKVPCCPPDDCKVDCKCLVKKYDCNKKNTQINNCIILALEFILSKLTSVGPIIDARHFGLLNDDIRWFEKFFETVLCVLTKSKICDCVTFSFFKVKNSEETIANRQYVLRAHYKVHGKKHKVDIPLDLLWLQLTRNDAQSFKGVNNYTVNQVNVYINSYRSINTSYFTH